MVAKPTGVTARVREFEAEAVCYLVCERLGIDNPSEEYLSNYVRGHETMPSISLEYLMKSVTLIEEMGRRRLKLRDHQEQR
jgi:hypothetical protein